MKALISPNEPVETGYRVAQIDEVGFEVAPPLFWIDCVDDIAADVYWYNPETQEFILKQATTTQATSVPQISGGPRVIA